MLFILLFFFFISCFVLIYIQSCLETYRMYQKKKNRCVCIEDMHNPYNSCCFVVCGIPQNVQILCDQFFCLITSCDTYKQPNVKRKDRICTPKKKYIDVACIHVKILNASFTRNKELKKTFFFAQSFMQTLCVIQHASTTTIMILTNDSYVKDHQSLNPSKCLPSQGRFFFFSFFSFRSLFIVRVTTV